jgi:ribosome biogenesis GTPase
VTTNPSSLGWDASLAAAFATYAADRMTPGRVVRVDRSCVHALTDAGFARATPGGDVLAAAAADPSALPCTGDWVALQDWPDDRTTVAAVLPRRTAVVRATVTPGVAQGQVLAANVDVAAIVEGLQPEPDLGRIERLLVLSWESGAQPIVLLTKADGAMDAEAIREDVRAAAPGVPVHVISAATGQGLDEMTGYLGQGRTLALLGPSGAGKSTLVNALAGAELLITRQLRADGKGRHASVRRELVVLPGGGLVIDTPGLRGVGLWDAGDSVDRVFADIEELAARCRFSDCGHDGEPGCAVLEALESGDLAERRLQSWRKLRREAEWIAVRQDARLRAERVKAWKRIHMEVRRSGRIRR